MIPIPRFASESSMKRDLRVQGMGALMTEMEDNYLLLRQLSHDLRALPDRWVSPEYTGLRLRLQVMERSPYTSTLQLSYELELDNDRHLAPDLLIRVYHDARLAEVLRCGDRQQPGAGHYDNTRGRQSIHNQLQANRFLHQWLGYCLRQGHRCPAETESPALGPA